MSIQKAIVPKIKKDVKTICAGPLKFEAVYYFCETDLEVAKRHRLQEWARTDFGVQLEIFDGQALSELLTEPSLFWIAIEYLGVPADIYPRSEETDARYVSNRQKWLVNDESVANYADFAQVKQGIRKATFEDDLRPDLSGWINKMEEFSAESFPMPMRRKAVYEVCVAALRGQNNLTAHIDKVRWYVESIEDSEDLSELDDLASLMTYCSTAQKVGHLDVGLDEVRNWVERVVEYTMERLGTMKWHEAQARLLQIRGQLSLAQFFFGVPLLKSEHLDWWKGMLVEAEKAPLFPIERFADLLTIFAPFEGEDPRYEEVTSRTDELLVKRTGGFAAAEKCRDRALAMFEAGNFVGAISQLHRAKFKWFAAETLRGSLLCMELLGECYQRLGFVYPAKYYWSGLANVALQQDRERFGRVIVRCLARLANACYYAGEWLDFLNAAGLAVSFESAYLPTNEHDKETAEVYQHMVLLRSLSHQFAPENDAIVESLIADVVGGEERYEWVLPPAAEDYAAISGTDPDVNWGAAEEHLAGRPFGDAGESRKIQFNALGIGWTLEFDNNFVQTISAETLASLLQVAIADLAAVDLVLLPLEVHVRLELTGGSRHEIDRLPDNKVATWRLLIPLRFVEDSAAEGGLGTAVLETLLEILYECSALPESEIKGIIDRAGENGLYSKAFFLGSYASSFKHRWGRETFDRPERRQMRPLAPARDFVSPPNPCLPWRDGDGPGYSRERAEGFLKNRYEIPLRSLRTTLPRLMEDQEFKSVVRRLRDEGLLDWEILVIVANMTSSERARRRLGRNTQFGQDRFDKMVYDLMHREEPHDVDPIDPGLFTYKECVMHHRFNQISVANTWGLQIRQLTPAIDAVKRLLDVRYHQRTDDVEHDAVLGC